MTPFLQFALTLAIIITSAKLGGYLSIKVGQPAVLGELIIGIILGPSLINILEMPYLTDQHLPEVIHMMAEMGVLLLMFLAGLDLHLSDVLRSGKAASLAGSFGVVLPLALGTLMGLLFAMDIQQAIFIGLILSATSVSISAQTLLELNVLRSRVGVGLLGAAVFDDILVLLGLSVFTALMEPESSVGLASILLIVLEMALFLGIASIFGWWAFPRLSRRITSLPVSQGLIGFSFVIILLYGWSAEVFGQMAAITGAFIAGLWLGRTPEKERIHEGVATIAYSVFIPVFFINMGLSANIRELTWETGLLMAVMVLVAVVSKVLGSGFGAYLGGFTRREAVQIGVGMMSRGEVGLIVAALGIEQGLLPDNTFSAVVGVVILTTLLAPPLLRVLFPRSQSSRLKVNQVSGGE